MKSAYITTQRSGPGLTIVINREQKLNALNKAVLQELHSAIRDALADAEIKGVIITGAGSKAFVAGADIAEFARFDEEQGRKLAVEGQRDVFDLIHHAPKPFIAAINGYALGGGLELALACHLRIASETARMGLPEVTLGLIPGYGGTQRLTQLVGRGRALEMILTGEMVTAQQALQYGLVNDITPDDQLLIRAGALLHMMATRSPKAIASAIKAVNAGLTEAGFEEEINAFSGCFGSDDFKEGVAAFLEKRKPQF